MGITFSHRYNNASTKLNSKFIASGHLIKISGVVESCPGHEVIVDDEVLPRAPAAKDVEPLVADPSAGQLVLQERGSLA